MLYDVNHDLRRRRTFTLFAVAILLVRVVVAVEYRVAVIGLFDALAVVAGELIGMAGRRLG